MNRGIQTIGVALAGLLLSGCSSLPEVSLPSVPSSIFAGSGETACPDLSTGPGPYSPPFPDDCRTMNQTASGVRYIPIVNGDINDLFDGRE